MSSYFYRKFLEIEIYKYIRVKYFLELDFVSAIGLKNYHRLRSTTMVRPPGKRDDTMREQPISKALLFRDAVPHV